MTILSFCIPTYNRSLQCLKLVNEILSFKSDYIEVIVSDNFSNDSTVEELRKIRDSRLVIITSDKNNGSLSNIYRSFKNAKGKYIYFSTDKDLVNSSLIGSFLEFLSSTDDMSCGFCSHSTTEISQSNEVVSKGISAVMKVGYKGIHPSGYFFNRDKLESVDYVEKYSDKAIVGEFFLDFILAELATMGQVGIYNKGLTILQTREDAASDKSLSIKGLNKNAYYTPKSRLNVAISQVKHINTLNLSNVDKNKLHVRVFVRALFEATLGYRYILGNRDLCEHYGLTCRDIKTCEILNIAYVFFLEFISETKSVRLKCFTRYSFDVLLYVIKTLLKKGIHSEK